MPTAPHNPDMGVIAVQASDSEVAAHLTNPQPAFDWLMLITQETPDYSEGGINMQAVEKIPVPYGLIIKKGPKCSDTFKVGQHILYPLHAGNDLPLHKDGEISNVKFIREEDVICTFELVKQGPGDKVMPIIKVGDKFKIGSGKPIYKTKSAAIRAYAAVRAKKHAPKPK